MKSRTHKTLLALGIFAIVALMCAPFALMAFGPSGGISFDWRHVCALGATLTFLDLAKANSTDVVAGLIEDNTIFAPELSLFPAEDLQEPGQLSYDTLHRTALPTVSFANAGEGFVPSKSALNLKTHQCHRFGGRIEAARHIADNWRKGGAAGYQAFEAAGVMESSLQLLGRQIWYGVAYDGKGFPGIKAFTPFGGSYTLNATGSTANTASSVYMVKFGEKYTQLMAGRVRNAPGIIQLPDFRIGDMDDPNNVGRKIEAYISELSSWMGLSIASEYSVVRICNLTEDNGKGLTDALLNTALQLFPANFRPDRIFMSKRSCTQLQNSRTVTLFGQGGVAPTIGTVAPRPTEYVGIPITETDSILNTDAIES